MNKDLEAPVQSPDRQTGTGDGADGGEEKPTQVETGRKPAFVEACTPSLRRDGITRNRLLFRAWIVAVQLKRHGYIFFFLFFGSDTATT